MKSLFLLCITALLAISGSSSASGPRIRYTVNDQWKFAAGEQPGAERVDFADASWERVALPHTWNVADGLDEIRGYRRGAGWYRRSLHLPASLAGRRIFLFFEGANQVAEVWINGARAGRHVGGYTAFTVDITEHAIVGRDNDVSVRVDNSHDDSIPPLNGDWTFYGGIYRDVWLVAVDPVHITAADHGSPGVFVDTPEVSAERAVVRIRGTVDNAGGAAVRVRILNRVLDAGRREIASTSSMLSVAARSSSRFEQRTRSIERPELWSPANPYVYTVRTEVWEGSRMTDAIENPLGFRWFRFDATQGFFLNGKPLKLNGTNRHQDHAGLGNALPDAYHRRDVEMVRDIGFNFLRLAHYPQDPAVLEATDRRGLLVWEEIPVVNLISMSPEFADNAERMLVEMIRQHYNHPSIVMWGYMNEVLLVRPNPIPDGYYQRALDLTRRLEATARKEDSTRATVMALSNGEVGDDHGLGDIPQILGMNLYFGWYYETIESLGRFLDSVHRERPDQPLIVSEYGAGSDERIHTADPRAFDFSSEYMHRFHAESFPQIEARPFVLGSAVWNNFDFGSEFRQDSMPGINNKGLFFYDRRPKDVSFYYRAALRDEPVLRIAREWNERAGSRPSDRLQSIRVYSNQPVVELFVNGVSAGSREITNRTAEWAVTLRDGVNAIRAQSGSIHDATEIHYQDRSAERTTIAINAGSPYSYRDGSGVIWEADRPYQSGGWGHLGGEPRLIHHRIFGTLDHALYQASQEGASGYRFDVPDGVYELTLGFASERVPAVRINGAPAGEEQELPPHTALVRRSQVAASGGGILVELAVTSGKTSISAIAVRRLDSAR